MDDDLFIIYYEFIYFDLQFLAKNMKDIPEFEIRRHLILDCWMLFQYKYLKNDQHQVSFNHFPLWNNSKEV